MAHWFEHPYALLLAIPAVAVLGLWFRALPAGRSRCPRGMLAGVAAVCLVLSAAGLTVPSGPRVLHLVVAADISESVFDLHAQTARVRELLGILNDERVEVSVVVFGDGAGLERPLSKLPPAEPELARTARRAGPDREKQPALSTPSIPALPNLAQPTVVIPKNGTDIGAALNLARGLLTDPSAERAIVLLSDFRDTRGRAAVSASALNGSGIGLLATPAVLGPSSDVYIADVRVPAFSAVGRATPIEVTVASAAPCEVVVGVRRSRGRQSSAGVGFETVELKSDAAMPGAELRRTVRILDHPEAPGEIVYSVWLSAKDGLPAGDLIDNNRRAAAVTVLAPSRWAVIARPGSTLAKLAADAPKSLSVDAVLFRPDALPRQASAYEPFTGILVDGLSAEELPDGPGLAALAEAVERGKGLVTLGGERAYGAGGHRPLEAWEKLLPIQFTPEDDRTRSILFLIDVSKSMLDRITPEGVGVFKKDFAEEQVGRAIEKLRTLDRIGLITFSGTARVAVPLGGSSQRAKFLATMKEAQTETSTDVFSALAKAREVLKDDDAEERIVVMLSDGIQSVNRPREEILAEVAALCPAPTAAGAPRRTTLYTFGIGVDAKDSNPAGEALLKDLAASGGGSYSPDFLKLAERLEKTFDAGKKDFYVRRDPFAILITEFSPIPMPRFWPQRLAFHNRVKAKPGTEASLLTTSFGLDGDVGQRRPDPLLVFSGAAWPGLSRRAALALTLDGENGTKFLASEARSLLPSVLSWAESSIARQRPGRTVEITPAADDTLEIILRAFDPAGMPSNGHSVHAMIAPVSSGATDGTALPQPTIIALSPSAPGLYRARVAAPACELLRVSVADESGTLWEQFVSVPFKAEFRRLGVDRVEMERLVQKAGGRSRVIESPRDLLQWAAERPAGGGRWALRVPLIAAAIVLLLLEFAARVMFRSSSPSPGPVRA